ncbi:MAG: prolyl oligopeptidase family serine peptidase [Planctomycetota bacterium]|jgi:pimeloyl-ACP methyl ester carboxylesterase
MIPRFLIVLLLLGSSALELWADGPADNQVEKIRPVPPPGIEVPAEVRESLSAALEPLKKSIEELSASKDPRIQSQLPDAEIFYRAVSLALNENGFFDPADFKRAKELIEEGKRRCEAIRANACYWLFINHSPYITVRGFRSKLDGTVQPYGVVFQSDVAASGRADVWCRGRSEKGLELQFLSTRMKNPDPLPDAGVLMIHPFGRYCNANKLAGEVDTLEALEHAMSQYPIDPKRVAIRGFSMGGAAAWHLAVHYPDRWFAATPGAGFSETPDFLKVFQSETLKPYWFEEKLWTMHDCPVWVRNLQIVPTIAYSGELDKQKQAADIMAKASWELPDDERFELTHIVAPKTAHSISPEAKNEIDRRLRILDPSSGLLKHHTHRRGDRIAFTTTTLRYNRAFWVTVDSLENHHEPSTIRATFQYGDPAMGEQADQVMVWIEGGITQFTLERDANQVGEQSVEIRIEDTERVVSKDAFEVLLRSDSSFKATFRVVDGFWQLVSPIESPASKLRKKHMLQGPIDDALLAPFLFVKPTASGLNPKIDQWVKSEFDHAVGEWHRQMRGDVRIKSSEELTASDIQNNHLILWGDPKSNPTIAKVLETAGIAKLPLLWNEKTIELGELKLDAQQHIPLMIYPNPLAPDRYIVFNSSFTYREYDYLNNARQVPKLPDWAMIDVTTAPNGRWPGKIVQADFFDEAWNVKPIRRWIEP